MTSVTVLLPVRDGETTIGETLNSLKRQTLRDFEVLLVDDGCRDATVRIARAVWGDDPRLRVLSPGTVGLVQALQMGLETSRSEFIARMDADDIAAPTRLERQLEFMRDHPDIHLAGTLVKSFSSDGLSFQRTGSSARTYGTR